MTDNIKTIKILDVNEAENGEVRVINIKSGEVFDGCRKPEVKAIGGGWGPIDNGYGWTKATC